MALPPAIPPPLPYSGNDGMAPPPLPAPLAQQLMQPVQPTYPQFGEPQHGYQVVHQPLSGWGAPRLPRRPLSRLEAAVKVQRWYRARMRRRHFLALVNRAIRRREHLKERRRLARRLRTNEMQLEEMKLQLQRDPGGREMAKWIGNTEAQAATRVQSRWRLVQSKKGYLKLLRQQQEEKAALALQAAYRRRHERQQPSAYRAAATRNPFAKPLDPSQLLKHEEDLFSKRAQFHSSMQRGMNLPELEQLAQQRFAEMKAALPSRQAEIMRTLVLQEQIRMIVTALEGSSWERPLPHGFTNAVLQKDAEQKHRQRWDALGSDLLQATDEDLLTVESRIEEETANTCLHKLEADLGYNFALFGEQ